ncbi:class I SAM-dependent RNA methyltransferase [Cryptosporangium arvum]|uniref:class I SAM-dependent RNA methyltransferase n=1 Tax=Cryptosporangium arvum TaxID=80871 RepID=UPI0004B6F305|nr:TRAM domain-containing protein [Cryptosporangium arvum]
MSWVGQSFEVDVEAFAHGGHCVGRHEGRVLFVRHALPGERVVAEVTEDRGGAFCRADAVSVVRASPDRVEPPCPYAHPGGCGGCDLQHVAPEAQRALKASVVREQLTRLGRVSGVDEIFGGVEELPGGALGWRTRVQFAVDPAGRAGLHPHRSREVLPVERCLIADPRIEALGVTDLPWPGLTAVEAVASGAGDDAVVLDVKPSGGRDHRRRPHGRSHGRPAPRRPVVVELPEELPESVAVLAASSPVRNTGRPAAEAVRGHRRVREVAAGRRWYVRADGFWQVHPEAPGALADAVLEALAPQPGESVLDLYAGAGLFAGVLGERVGPGGRVVAVEADKGACDDARRNLRDLANVEVVTARVDKALDGGLAGEHDLVVLDPPRSGAGAAVVREVAARTPRAVAYVACDPAAFARDVATFAEEGYVLTRVRAFDAFPMTHHVECVGTLVPAGG